MLNTHFSAHSQYENVCFVLVLNIWIVTYNVIFKSHKKTGHVPLHTGEKTKKKAFELWEGNSSFVSGWKQEKHMFMMVLIQVNERALNVCILCNNYHVLHKYVSNVAYLDDK